MNAHEPVDRRRAMVPLRIAGGAALILLGPMLAVAGLGLVEIPQAPQVEPLSIERLDGDLYVHGRLRDPLRAMSGPAELE